MLLMEKNPYSFVIDSSMTMAWCFEDESDDYTEIIQILF